MDPTPIVIAEIGCVHAGSVDRAKDLIYLAKQAGADVAKFQKRNPKESTPKHLWNKPHPNESFAYGRTYLEHRENLELSIEDHTALKTFCEDIGIIYSTSVWDMTSAKEIITLDPAFIKVPSAQNHNLELLDYLYANFNGSIHISTGMTTSVERKELCKYIQSKGWDRTVVYHCTSTYPCSFDNLYLAEIKNLREEYNSVGFSNHGYGIASDIAALALGARYFERHFVDDRLFPHTDSSASLEPEGFRKLCRDIKNVFRGISYKPLGLDALEAVQRAKLRGPQ